MPPKRRDLENPIQRSIVEYLRLNVPGNPIVHHSPNELGLSGEAAARQVAKHKMNGMLPGFPDLVVICYAGIFFLEVKAEGNTLSPAQKAVHLDIIRLGYRVAVVRSIDDVREVLDGWAIWRNDRRRA